MSGYADQSKPFARYISLIANADDKEGYSFLPGFALIHAKRTNVNGFIRAGAENAAMKSDVAIAAGYKVAIRSYNESISASSCAIRAVLLHGTEGAGAPVNVLEPEPGIDPGPL